MRKGAVAWTPETPETRTIDSTHQNQTRLSKAKVQDLIAAYQSGKTVYELARQFDCHRTTVSQHLKANGAKMRREPLTDAQIDEAISLYDSGLSCVRVGQILGANAETIRNELRGRDVVLRGPHDRPIPRSL